MSLEYRQQEEIPGELLAAAKIDLANMTKWYQGTEVAKELINAIRVNGGQGYVQLTQVEDTAMPRQAYGTDLPPGIRITTSFKLFTAEEIVRSAVSAVEHRGTIENMVAAFVRILNCLK